MSDVLIVSIMLFPVALITFLALMLKMVLWWHWHKRKSEQWELFQAECDARYEFDLHAGGTR